MSGSAPLRFGLLTDSRDWRRVWSGTVGRMADALDGAGHSVEALPAVLPRVTGLARLGSKLQRRATGIDMAPERTRWMAWLKARAVQGALAGAPTGLDALLAPVSSTILPYLRTRLPVIYVSDATLPLMATYYDRYAHFPARVLDRAVDLERRAVARADLAVYPTRWAADSARTDLGLDPARLLLAPFGPNMRDLPDAATVAAAIARRGDGPPRLLFCAVEWARKGGDILLEAMRLLVGRGVAPELTILGVRPPESTALPPGVTVIPYLDKRIPAEARRMREVFAGADLFVMPTRAECFGVVFCEAAAHGVPSLATETGGVSEVVRDGATGRLLPLDAGGDAWAEALARMLADRADLARMGAAARADFEDRLNWSAWAEAVGRRTRALIAAPERAVASGSLAEPARS